MTYNPNAPYNIEKQVLKKSLFSIISRIRHPEAFMNDKRVVLIFDFQVFILFGSILQLLFNKFKSNLYLNKSGVLWYPPKRNKNSNFDQSTSFWLWGRATNKILYDMTNNQHYGNFKISEMYVWPRVNYQIYHPFQCCVLQYLSSQKEVILIFYWLRNRQ